MTKFLNASEMGKIGGKNRWKNIDREERRRIMRKLKVDYWNKKKSI